MSTQLRDERRRNVCACGREIDRRSTRCLRCWNKHYKPPVRRRFTDHYPNGREVVTYRNFRQVRAAFTPAELAEYAAHLKGRRIEAAERAEYERDAVELVVAGVRE